MAWTGTATNSISSAQVSGADTVPADLVATDVEFGLLTKAGEGGVPVTGTTFASGNSLGHWQIIGGILTPTSAAVSAGFSGAPYSLVFNDSSTLTISCPANVRHVANTTQANAAANDEPGISGKTVKIRAGNYGTLGAYNAFVSIANRATFTAADENNRPVFSKIQLAGATTSTVGNVTFSKLKVYRAQSETAHSYIAPINSNHLVSSAAGAGVLFDDCEIYSDLGNSIDGSFMKEAIFGIDATGGNITIQNCDIHNVAYGIRIGGTNTLIDRNTIHSVHADAINVRGGSVNLTISNNHMYDFAGLGNILHADAVQFTDPGSGNFTNVLIEGNVIFGGDFLNRALMSANFDATISTVSIASSTTLTAATHASKQINVTAAGVTLTLPAASDCPQETIWFSGGASNAFTIAGAAGGNVTVNSSNYQGTYAVRSDGTEWTRATAGLRVGYAFVRANYTFLARHNNLTWLVDATTGNVTLTLPASSGMTRVNVIRLDQTANTVTIQPPAAHTMSFRSGTVSNVTLPPSKAFTFTAGSSAWTAGAGTYENQGIFGNGGTGYNYADMTIRGNIIWADASHIIRIEKDFQDQKIYNNTCLRTFHPDRDADGTVDSFDGLFIKQVPAVRMSGDSFADITRRFAANNFIPADLNRQDGTATTAHGQDNIVLNLGGTNVSSTLTSLTTYVQGDEIGDFYPLTVDEAIDAVLAKASGPLDGTYIGALGTTRSNGYWDFTAKQKNPSAPEPTIA
jgi:hypothetical protein